MELGTVAHTKHPSIGRQRQEEPMLKSKASQDYAAASRLILAT